MKEFIYYDNNTQKAMLKCRAKDSAEADKQFIAKFKVDPNTVAAIHRNEKDVSEIRENPEPKKDIVPKKTARKTATKKVAKKKTAKRKRVAKKDDVEEKTVTATPKRRGRPPGTGGRKTLVKIKMSDLMDLIGKDGSVMVGRKWIEDNFNVSLDGDGAMTKITVDSDNKEEPAVSSVEEL